MFNSGMIHTAHTLTCDFECLVSPSSVVRTFVRPYGLHHYLIPKYFYHTPPNRLPTYLHFPLLLQSCGPMVYLLWNFTELEYCVTIGSCLLSLSMFSNFPCAMAALHRFIVLIGTLKNNKIKDILSLCSPNWSEARYVSRLS